MAFAIPLNVIAWGIFQLSGLAFNFGVATHLLAGNISEGPVHAEVAAFFRRFWFLNAWTYFTLLVASYIVGSLGRRTVWASRLDLRIPYLRVRHEWFYVLHGRVGGFPKDVLSYADVMTRLPDIDDVQTRLFRGVVVDFQISPTGGIETLVLGDAKRGSGRRDDFHWKPVPSDRLVLMGGDIHSINVTYFAMDDPDRVPTRGDRWRSWWRSFCLEQS